MADRVAGHNFTRAGLLQFHVSIVCKYRVVADANRRFQAGRPGTPNHFDHVIEADVVLEVEKLRHKAEVTMQVTGATLHAESTQEDMYAAIDSLIDKLDRQVCKHKEKIVDRHR